MKTTTLRKLATAASVVALILLVSGCSTVRLVDSDVTAYPLSTAQNVAVPATYRFERLPSEMAQGEMRGALEALAEPELAKVGLQRNGAAAQYSVQLEVRIYRDPQAPWDLPTYPLGYATPYPVPNRYGAMWRTPSLSLQFEYPYYRRDMHVIIRRLGDIQVIFESRANHDGRWPDDEAVLPAMLRAALTGFPNPPQGVRRVVVEIPR